MLFVFLHSIPKIKEAFVFSVEDLDAASSSFLPCEVSECFLDLVFSKTGLLALRSRS